MLKKIAINFKVFVLAIYMKKQVDISRRTNTISSEIENHFLNLLKFKYRTIHNLFI